MSKLKKQYRDTIADHVFPIRARLSTGSILVGQSDAHQNKKMRPFFVWATYKREDLDVLPSDAIEVFSIKSSPIHARQRGVLPVHNFLPINEGTSIRTSYIDTPACGIIQNDKNHVWFRYPNFGVVYLPDLILRRVDALLHSPVTNTEKDLQRPLRDYGTRKGIILKTVFQGEVLSRNMAPDVADAQLARTAFTIPHVLEQSDIDAISKIARNYTDYCKKRGIPVTWPTAGRYPDWPESFMRFIDPQAAHKSFVSLPHTLPANTPERT